MRNISIREIRNALPRLDDLVAREGELIITKRGKPIAKVIPLQPGKKMPSHADLRKSMPHLATPSETLIGEDRERIG